MKIRNLKNTLCVRREQDFQQLFMKEYMEIKKDLTQELTEVEEEIQMYNLIHDESELRILKCLRSSLMHVQQQYDYLIQRNLN
jgi:hypothetical protein